MFCKLLCSKDGTLQGEQDLFKVEKQRVVRAVHVAMASRSYDQQHAITVSCDSLEKIELEAPELKHPARLTKGSVSEEQNQASTSGYWCLRAVAT